MKMAAGDKATLWYCSANRDESKFADPWMFDVTRTRIRTSASAAAARTSAWAPTWPAARSGCMFEELHREIPDIVATDEPARLLSPFIHGIKRLPVSWTPPN